MKLPRLLVVILLAYYTNAVARTDLLQFFEKAVKSDPTYLQVVETTLAKEKNISINIAALLPKIGLAMTPQANRVTVEGVLSTAPLSVYPPLNKIRTFDTQLTATQTIIDFARLSNYSSAKLSAKQAHADLNAAFQDLILRVAEAYLRVLYDEENLSDSKTSKDAFAKQLFNARQLYKAKSISIEDVYNAEAAYNSANARYITAQAILATDKDFLGTMAGKTINDLAKLSPRFPISTPSPNDMESWVILAKRQNWKVKSYTYGMEVAREHIKKFMAHHLPTVSLQAKYEIEPYHATGTSTLSRPGSSKFTNAVIAANINIPLIEGGLVIAQVSQAKHNFQVAYQQLEAVYRNTTHTTRQNYLNMLANIQKINADVSAIKSSMSYLKKIQDKYKSGSATMVDLLNQQEKVLQAKAQYATNRHAYIMNLLQLKNAAGTLCLEDLAIINSWLH